MAESDDYRRGHDAGGIAERLDGHDRHFSLINGHLGDIAHELQGLKLAVQRLGDQAAAHDAAAAAAAAAVKDADDARRNRTERGWAPWRKALAVVAGIVAIAGLIATLIIR